MSCSQKNYVNTSVCDGCEKKCSLGYIEYYGSFYPCFSRNETFTRTTEYIDNQAVKHNIKSGFSTWEMAAKKAFEIAQTCGKYKTH